MAAFVLSNVVGLVRTMLVGAAFGTDPDLDAFNAAVRVPDLLFNLVAGGALASAFIPAFTGFLGKDEGRAWRLTSAVLNWVVLAALTVSVLGALCAPWLVATLVGRGFAPAQQDLTVQLMRILLLTPAIFALSGLLMSVQNARGRFLMPALAPSCYWLGMILGLLFLSPRLGIFGLAWGATLGALLHLGLQVLGMHGLAAPYTPGLGRDDPAVGEVARRMAPRLLGVGANQLNFLVTATLASYIAGGVSSLDYAWRIFTMPLVVIAQGLAVAALPAFAVLVAEGELRQVALRLSDTLRGMLFLALPATVGLWLLREPIVAMLFQRRAFGPESTVLVASALGFFAIGLVGHSTVELVSRAYYALGDTRTPVLVAGYTVVLNIALSLALGLGFQRVGWEPVGGLALATSLAVTLEMVVLVRLLGPKLGGIGLGPLVGQGLWRMLLAAGLMGLMVAAWLWLTAGRSPWLVGLGGVALGALLYGAAAWGLGSREARALAGPVLARLGQRPWTTDRARRRRFDPPA